MKEEINENEETKLYDVGARQSGKLLNWGVSVNRGRKDIYIVC